MPYTSGARFINNSGRRAGRKDTTDTYDKIYDNLKPFYEDSRSAPVAAKIIIRRTTLKQ